jgi:1-acyl-sn-glycerol-3-phosphate acyltransferase
MHSPAAAALPPTEQKRDRPLTRPGRWAVAAARDRRELHRRLSGRLFYRLGWLFGRWTSFCCLNVHVIRPEAMDRAGGYLVACSHLSHLEPWVVGVLYKRHVDWVTRVEFYNRLTAWWFARIGAFPVNRFGVAVSTIRTAVARVRAGRIVGIFPEGGVCTGRESACRGGQIKRGVCLVSQRSGAPILPCVVVGTHALNEISPWLPLRRGKLWVAFGEPVFPRADIEDKKAARAAMADELQRQFVALYNELLDYYGLDDASVP